MAVVVCLAECRMSVVASGSWTVSVCVVVALATGIGPSVEKATASVALALVNVTDCAD